MRYEATIELGRSLFFDNRLSLDSSISCASCHQPKYAFTDKRKTAIGIFNRENPRNSPSLFNVKFAPQLMFDNVIPTLEMQIIVPLQEHNEMGMTVGGVLARLSSDSTYQELAGIAYGRHLDAYVLTRSIAAYERTLLSNNSRFDQFYYRQKSVLSQEEIAGWKLFSEELNCISCHSLPHFTNYQSKSNGMTNTSTEDMGRFRATGDSSDIGKFKVPSLRNVTLTAPYMHDGTIPHLREVIKKYSHGGLNVKNKDSLIVPINLKLDQIENLFRFFETLVDTTTYKSWNSTTFSK